MNAPSLQMREPPQVLPAGVRWTPIEPPAGVAFPTPTFVTSDDRAVFARASAARPTGEAVILVRTFPRFQQLRASSDRYYQASGGSPSAGALGSPPPSWLPWSGELPTAVAAAFEAGRRAGQDFRATIGSHEWTVRADARGRAAYGLGAPPHPRRVLVSAWRRDLPPPVAARPPRRAVRAVAYAGEPAAPWPPAGPGWAETAPDEATRLELAGMLGELPANHYADTTTPTGLWRVFSYETAAGTRAAGALRYWGSSLGDPSTLGDAAGDLAAFAAQIASGDGALAAGNWVGAITAYQNAGQAGATTLGPEIDTQTNGASQPTTQQAWGINTTLATITNDPAAAQQADAQNAQGLARQMAALYQAAIAMAPAAPSGGGGGTSAQATAAISAAQNLVTYFGSNPCTQNPLPVVGAFQQAYNGSGLGPAVTPDSKYGPLTQAAVQLTLTFGGDGTAPNNCFTNAPAPGPGPNPPPPPSPAPHGTTTPTVAAASMTGGKIAAIVGAVAVVGALGWAAYTGNLPSFTTSPT